MFNQVINILFSISILLWNTINNFWTSFLIKTNFLEKYYRRNENIWNDGFLFDFLQKKTFDNWLRNYVIYTGFLFSERVVFDLVTRLYNDIIVWPQHNNIIFETSNTASTLNTLLYLYFTGFILIILIFSLL